MIKLNFARLRFRFAAKIILASWSLGAVADGEVVQVGSPNVLKVVVHKGKFFSDDKAKELQEFEVLRSGSEIAERTADDVVVKSLRLKDPVSPDVEMLLITSFLGQAVLSALQILIEDGLIEEYHYDADDAGKAHDGPLGYREANYYRSRAMLRNGSNLQTLDLWKTRDQIILIQLAKGSRGLPLDKPLSGLDVGSFKNPKSVEFDYGPRDRSTGNIGVPVKSGVVKLQSERFHELPAKMLLPPRVSPADYPKMFKALLFGSAASSNNFHIYDDSLNEPAVGESYIEHLQFFLQANLLRKITLLKEEVVAGKSILGFASVTDIFMTIEDPYTGTLRRLSWSGGEWNRSALDELQFDYTEKQSAIDVKLYGTPDHPKQDP